MKSMFTSRRNKHPYTNEGKERKEAPFFARESKTPFFNVANGGAVQAKLTVGQPGDKYEKEADHMADAVVNNTSKPAIQNKEISSIQRESLATPQEDEKLGTAEQRVEEDKLVQEKPEIQKMESPEEEMVNKMEGKEEETIQKMEGEEEETVQTKNESATQTASTGLSSKIKSKAGTGKKMSPPIKSEMESGFGRDFSTVNIHTGQDAVTMNKKLGAQAFTHGKDIYFNSGKYNPDTVQGKRLLAHELTHVVQQSGVIRRQMQTQKQNSSIQIELGFSAFIPNKLNAPFYKYNQAWKNEPDPFSSKLFASDNRSYNEKGTSRIWQNGIVKFKGTNLVNRNHQKSVGESHQADPVYSNVNGTKKITEIKNIVGKRAPDKGEINHQDKGLFKGFSFRGEASYPFSRFAPDIDFKIDAFTKMIKKGNTYYAFVIFSGFRNNFPAYEAFVKINGSVHYLYTYKVDRNDGPGLINLNSSTKVLTSKIFKI